MRVFARLAVLGILVISCRETIIDPIYEPELYEPPPCTPVAPDTTFGLYDDSMRVVVGAAASLGTGWAVSDGCTWTQLPATELTWTVRDTLVVQDTVPEWSDGRERFILPRASGETVVVVETPTLVDSIFVSVPDTVTMGPVIAVGAGTAVSCAVTDDGTVRCWGGLYSGVLGDWDDPWLGQCLGGRCTPMPVPRATGAESVHVGGSHACILDAAGAASCWGDNGYYQLGNANREPSHTPVPVSGGHAFASLSLGYSHTCGVTTDGAGYCWGDAQSGRLGGNYRFMETEIPVNVDSTLSWLSIEVNGATTCGVSEAGHLYCWGALGPSNTQGPAGSERCEYWTGKDGSTNSTPCSYTPLRVELTDPLGADTVFVQTSGTCALTDAGSLYCYDTAGATYRPLSGFGPFETITTFGMHSCALTAGGTAWCWGSNWSGQLGDGSNTGRSLPVTVSGGHIWDQIVVGSEHTCGLTMGEAWCWGSTSSGEAGETILTPQLTPAKVHGQD